MTIREAAEKYNITKQAIYQRLKTNGINIDTMKDKETGELTADAEAVLYNLFGSNSQEFKKKKVNLQEELRQAKEEISSKQKEIDILTSRLDAAEKALADCKETLMQERSMFTRLLPAPEKQHTEPHSGFFHMLFRTKGSGSGQE